MQKSKPKMSAKELNSWLERHDLSPRELAEVLAVTKPAVDHWLTGRRHIPATVIKLLKFFDCQPGILQVFGI